MPNALPRLLLTRPSSRLRVLLALMLAGLVGCIGTAGLLFVKRDAIVQGITRSGGENFTWAFSQMRVEFYRLMMTADAAVGPAGLAPAAASNLRQRYEIFVSRVDIVSDGSYRALMQDTDIYREAVPRLRQLVAAVDAELTDTPGFNERAAALLLGAQGELATPTDELSAKAIEVDSRRLQRMRDDLLSLQTYEVANLAFQLIMLLAFGAISLVGLFRLDRQRRHLADTADQLKEARQTAEAAAEAKRWALQRALDEEQRHGHLQQRFVSMASHEFRTPLAIIDSSAQRLLRKLDRVPRQELAERIEGIRHTVARISDLIDTMLEAGRAREGKTSFKPVHFNLLRHLILIIKQQRDISPHHTITEDLQAVPISFYGDAQLITHILVNILSNAIKYSPAGGEIRVSAGRAGHDVEISVTDQGVGIPEDELPNLFERFFRASTSAGIPGTGLGLELVRRFLELHGGAIRVDSKVGTGTTFTFTLPIRSPQSESGRPARRSPDAVSAAQGSR